jgi:hypothetical protein
MHQNNNLMYSFFYILEVAITDRNIYFANAGVVLAKRGKYTLRQLLPQIYFIKIF